MAEPNAAGKTDGLGPSQGVSNPNLQGIAPRAALNSAVDLSLPKLDSVKSSVLGLTKAFQELLSIVNSFASSASMSKMVGQINNIATASNNASKAAKTQAQALSQAGSGRGTTGFGGSQPTTWQMQSKRDPAEMVSGRGITSTGGTGGTTGTTTGNMSTTGFSIGGNQSRPAGSNLRNISASTSDTQTASSTGQGIGNAITDFFGNITGQRGILNMISAGFNGMAQLYGAIAGGGIQYAYNRVNGPTGNANAMLQLAQALAPNATMMSAATGTQMSMNRMIAGLAQRMPVMGTQQDMLSTILSGQSVGALMAGTPERAGFFESVRQMQALNPGMSPTTSSSVLAGYMGNVRAQQTGVFLGQGAFTMIGQGGRYKTLAEWAEGITKFLQQQRPGRDQGKAFAPEELIAQNFPGSNINAWFQMMGVPQEMVDYWWQYVLTNVSGKPASQVTSDLLQNMAGSVRGINLGYERLRNTTQSTRREFLMGGQMYESYAARESADRRFNVAMQQTDRGLGQILRTTNVGRILSILPTPIMEMLMPMLYGFATSPLGAGAAAIGGLMGDPIGDPIGGSYGETGGMDTAHLSPDLSKRVNAMLRANPKLRISSSYRDTVTQNRLRRNGVSTVGPASQSKHTRGWAVDIGPVSEMGWLNKNAGKFGLQTASAVGEPWHIQLAGTMPDSTPAAFSQAMIGDPNFMPLGEDFSPSGILGMLTSGTAGLAGSVAKSLLEGLTSAIKPILESMLSPLQVLMTEFMGGSGKNISNMIDFATQMYSKLMTAPLSGLANVFGKVQPSSSSELTSLIDKPFRGQVPISTYAGFTSSGMINNSTARIFGDPVSLMSQTPTTIAARIGSPVIIQAEININGSSASPMEARKSAAILVDHIEDEVSRRKWLVS